MNITTPARDASPIARSGVEEFTRPAPTAHQRGQPFPLTPQLRVASRTATVRVLKESYPP
ncbi:hypothetical protein GCM10010372_34210 [Streptomyces tauricus]|nr:hypothetical protein GCM10010372_34210 [Streptomyces tauricus]